MKKIIVIINSKSRQGAQIKDTVITALADAGHKLLNSTEDSNTPFEDIILRHHSEAEAVLVVGGDGTVNACLPALIKTKLPALVFPQGTANNLATTLGISKKLPEVLALFENGQITEIDLGQANGIPFVNLIGVGLSTRINRAVPAQLKRWVGPLAFAITAFRVVRSMVPFRAHIIVNNGGQRESHLSWSWQITVCNGRLYGSHLVIHEDASLSDQTLHGLSTEVDKWWHSFLLAPAFMRGRFRPKDPVHQFEGQEIEIVTRRRHHVDIDGDIKTKSPVKISVLPKALKVFVPRPMAQSKAP